MQAIGYIRFSRDERSEGNSVERQTSNINTYCERAGLDLGETLIDDGYSAFKGEHISRGKLGQLLSAVDAGKHRGKALIVEHIDRLSRLGIEQTSTIISRLLKGGVEVHVTQENRAIRSGDDLVTAILNVISSHTANEYSKKLKERIGGAWKAKKHESPTGIAITGSLPAWLTGKAGEPMVVVEDRAVVVRQMFEWAASGLGQRMIVKRLTETGVPPFAKGPWQTSYIGKILNNRAVLGEYQPRFKRDRGHGQFGKPDGQVRVGFFPQIVSDELWQRAKTAMSSRRREGFGRGGKVGKAHSLFSGLVWDASQGERWAMHIVNLAHRGLALRTDWRAAKLNRVDYQTFEGAFLQWLDRIDWRSVIGGTAAVELLEAERKLATATINLERVDRQIATTVDLLVDVPSAALKFKLAKLEAESATLAQDRADAEKALDTLNRTHREFLAGSVQFGQLLESQDVETRVRLRHEIRRKVASIDFVRFRPTTLAIVRFTNGVERRIEMGEPDKKGWTPIKLWQLAEE